MPKVAYVPYSEDYANLFSFCGISLPVGDYGGNQGWDAPSFSDALGQAWDYLIENPGGVDDATLDHWFELASGDYPVNYWSTEKYVVD